MNDPGAASSRRIARRVYRWALWVFPSRIRDDHGVEMEEMFAHAWAEARARGGTAPVRQALRSARDVVFNGLVARFEGGMGMETWTNDLTSAIRSLMRRPAFTAVAVLTLALGLGGTTAIWSIVDAAFLDPLPYPDGDALVVPYNAPRPREGGGFAAFSAPMQVALAQERVFAAVTGIAPRSANVGGTDAPERVTAADVDASFFAVAGVTPVAGRGFTAEEDRPGGPSVAVIGHDLWNRRFASDPSTVGSDVVIDGVPTTIVGVMPPSFRLLFEGVELWRPMRIDEGAFDGTSAVNNNRVLVARLPTGVSSDAVAARLPGVIERVRERFPDALSEEHAIRLVPLRTHLYGGARGSLFILLGAVGLVLLVACANFANLLLVRGEARRTELAVRAALGGSRGRIVRGLVTESLVIALLGALVGQALAMGTLGAIRPLAPSNVPLPTAADLDPSVLGFTLLIALLTGLSFGLIPARAATARDLRSPLEGSRGAVSTARGRARNALVVAEVALTAVLLVGSGLLLHSLWRLQAVDPGFDTQDRMAADIALPRSVYAESDAMNRFYRGLLEGLAATPAVTAAGLGQFLPLAGSSNWGFEAEGGSDGGVRFADYTLFTPGYLEAMGMRVVSGRGVEWSDAESGAAPVMWLSESMANQLWPGQNPVGRRINVNLGERVWREVVGVVSDVRNRSLAERPDAIMYFPPHSLPMTSPRSMTLVVHHAESDPPVSTARDLVSSLDAAVPLTRLRTLDDVARDSERRRLFMLALLAAFAGLAVTLASVGLYGVVSYTFSLRTREIGLRMAIGAGRGNVLAMVTSQSAVLVGLGLALGLGSASLAGGVLETLLFEVAPLDPTVYAGVACFVALTAALATWIPARRATSIDPARVLRG